MEDIIDEVSEKLEKGLHDLVDKYVDGIIEKMHMWDEIKDLFKSLTIEHQFKLLEKS